MRLVVDASVATKWLINEPDSALADTVLAQDLIAPHILPMECANALIRRLRMGEIDEPLARARLQKLSEFPVILYEFDEAQAIEIALKLRHPVWDCAYLALAHEHRIPLMTADERFYRRSEEEGYGDSILLLSRYA